MRIRTTRQAREIRQGIQLGRNPLFAYIRRPFLEAFPLMRNAYYRTKNKPPAGVNEQLRVDHPGRKEWLSTYDSATAEAHVIPISDDVPHEVSEECICRPAPERIERPNGDAWLYTHSSLDGRELTEPDRKQT